MPAASPASRSEPPGSLENDARQIALFFARHQAAILVFVTLVYLAGAVLHARTKPFWYDEIITLVAASEPDLPTALKAAQQTDASPPLPHLLIHLCVRWFGTNEVAARIPAILGFWIFCLCLFRFTRRRIGILYALTALLLPIVTEAYSYSVEARAYGPELAFCGLALVAWQSAAERRRRRWALAGLAVSLAGALLCHYYAVLLYVPLAGGEALRAYRARKVDWGIWAAFGIGAAPLIWRAATIATVIHEFKHTWSPPYVAQVFEFWDTGLQRILSFLVFLLLLIAVTILMRRKEEKEPPGELPSVPDHELAAAALFLVIPALAVMGALLVTHTFTPRYAEMALAGFALLAPIAVAYGAGGRALPGFLLMLAAAVGLGIVTLGDLEAPRNPFDGEPILRQALTDGPVVIPDGQLFLQMWYYAPQSLKPRLLFLADSAAAVRYMGFDTIDDGIMVLRPWARISAMEYSRFATPGREFLVYQNTLRPAWLLQKIVADGGSAEIRKISTIRELVRVRLAQ
ncbi:MAG TPA: glycosyltransferase family 39 protein [Bryobacteraceae bacterium]|nr:glycosyltransferase family 39 protein [Bryobacteraceae bacterium]